MAEFGEFFVKFNADKASIENMNKDIDKNIKPKKIKAELDPSISKELRSLSAEQQNAVKEIEKSIRSQMANYNLLLKEQQAGFDVTEEMALATKELEKMNAELLESQKNLLPQLEAEYSMRQDMTNQEKERMLATINRIRAEVDGANKQSSGGDAVSNSMKEASKMMEIQMKQLANQFKGLVRTLGPIAIAVQIILIYFVIFVFY